MTNSLHPLYQGWHTYQDLLIKALEPLSLDQLSLRAAPHLRSTGENAAHIVITRAGWLYFVLGLGGDVLGPFGEWGMEPQAFHPPADLIHGLEVTWGVIEDALIRWTPDDLAVLVQDTNENGEIQTYTRQWVIWHLIEHDLHHGGELSFTLGMHGLPGIEV
jgi:uncharacterized damage-inducible protein DinB